MFFVNRTASHELFKLIFSITDVFNTAQDLVCTENIIEAFAFTTTV
jgi:hypothetical protein